MAIRQLVAQVYDEGEAPNMRFFTLFNADARHETTAAAFAAAHTAEALRDAAVGAIAANSWIVGLRNGASTALEDIPSRSVRLPVRHLALTPVSPVPPLTRTISCRSGGGRRRGGGRGGGA
jgi:hypothetical protein